MPSLLGALVCDGSEGRHLPRVLPPGQEELEPFPDVRGERDGPRKHSGLPARAVTGRGDFLSPHTSPVCVTFSAADMQWQDLHRHFPGFSDLPMADDRTRRDVHLGRSSKEPAHRRSLLGPSLTSLHRARLTSAPSGRKRRSREMASVVEFRCQQSGILRTCCC